MGYPALGGPGSSPSLGGGGAAAVRPEHGKSCSCPACQGAGAPALGGASADRNRRSGRVRGVACATCDLGDSVRAGRMTTVERDDSLRSWVGAAEASPVIWSSSGERYLPSGSNVALNSITRVGCSSAERAVLNAARDYVLDNLGDIADCPPNISSCFSWLPSSYPRSARELAAWALDPNDHDKIVRLRCVDETGRCSSSVESRIKGWSYPQYLQRYLDIYICRHVQGQDRFTSQSGLWRTRYFACLIVHELMHCFGQVDPYADRLEPDAWGCNPP